MRDATSSGARIVALAALAVGVLPATAGAQTATPTAYVEQGGPTHALTFGGGCLIGPGGSICADPPATFAAAYVDIDAAASFRIHFRDEVSAVRVRVLTRNPGAGDVAVSVTLSDAHTAQVIPAAPLGGRLVVSAALTAGGDESFAGELPHGLLVAPVPTGDSCAAATRARVTDSVTGAPVPGARVGATISAADGTVPLPTDGGPATKAGFTSSGPTTFPAPVLLCVPFVPAPTPPGTARAPVARELTLRAVAGVRLGALRFRASSTTAGVARVTARIGGVTVRRSVTFPRAGSLSFALQPSASQARRLRRELARGRIVARVTITAGGARATASATLRR